MSYEDAFWEHGSGHDSVFFFGFHLHRPRPSAYSALCFLGGGTQRGSCILLDAGPLEFFLTDDGVSGPVRRYPLAALAACARGRRLGGQEHFQEANDFAGSSGRFLLPQGASRGRTTHLPPGLLQAEMGPALQIRPAVYGGVR